MQTEKTTDRQAANSRHHSYHVRLPGFVTDEDIGLGDAIKRVTSIAGIRPCGRCEQRAAALNRWLTFTGRYSK